MLHTKQCANVIHHERHFGKAVRHAWASQSAFSVDFPNLSQIHFGKQALSFSLSLFTHRKTSPDRSFNCVKSTDARESVPFLFAQATRGRRRARLARSSLGPCTAMIKAITTRKQRQKTPHEQVEPNDGDHNTTYKDKKNGSFLCPTDQDAAVQTTSVSYTHSKNIRRRRFCHRRRYRTPPSLRARIQPRVIDLVVPSPCFALTQVAAECGGQCGRNGQTMRTLVTREYRAQQKGSSAASSAARSERTMVLPHEDKNEHVDIGCRG